MRPIKYRAIFDGKIEYKMSLEGMFAHYENGSCKLEQFTGFQDHNGKEIYEGDLIYINISRNKNYINNMPKEYHDLINEPIIKNSPILYIGGSYMVRSKDNHVYTLGNFFSNVIEITGNIHENGDMLCDQKK